MSQIDFIIVVQKLFGVVFHLQKIISTFSLKTVAVQTTLFL